MDQWNELLRQFPEGFRELFSKVELYFQKIREIRIRAGREAVFRFGEKEYFLLPNGKLTCQIERGQKFYEQDIKKLIEYMGSYSLYAYEEELRQGFLTIKGGHRVGIAGKVVLEKGRVKNFKYISSVNIRISHEIKGAGDQALSYLYDPYGLCHTLIVSPPGCGKTTLLRDLIRQISNGWGKEPGRNVGVVDERSEIGGCYLGIPQNDLGVRTDLLDCCPKAEGMMMLIRSMAPDVIAVDEIGKEEDVQAMENALRCGCRLLATIHGTCMEEIKEKRVLSSFLRDKVFQRFLFLDKAYPTHGMKSVYNCSFQPIYERGDKNA